MKKSISMTCILLVVAMLLSACAGSSAPSTSGSPTPSKASSPTEAKKEAKPLKIAVIGPLTGDSAQYGIQFKRGTTVFANQYNAAGGWNGSKIELEFFDDKNDPKETVNIASKIVSDGNYMAVVGSFSSSSSLAMAPVFDEAKLVSVSPSVSHPDYTKNFKYTYRLSHVNTDESKFAAHYMIEKWGSKKIGVIYSNNDWGLTLDQAFVDSVKQLGGEIMGNEPFILGQTKDFSPMITKLKSKEIDSIYVIAMYAESSQIFQQLKAMNMNVKTMGTSSSIKTETVKLSGDAGKDVRFLSTFTLDDPSPKTAAFIAAIKKDYDAQVDNFTLRAYDSMDLIFDALKRCKSTDSTALRDEIAKTTNFEGTGGKFSIDANRNVNRQFIVMVPSGDFFKVFEKPDIKY